MLSKKQNIVILHKDLRVGGAEKQALILAKVLADYHRVYFVVFNDFIHEKNKLFIESNNIDVTIFKGNIVTRAISLLSFLKKNKINIIFSYLLTSNVLGGIVGSLAGVKYRIGGVRSAFLLYRKEYYERLIHNYFNTKTVFNNYSGANRYVNRGFNKRKIHVIPNCITVPSSLMRNSKDIVEIISVGRFVYIKDYVTSINAVKAVFDKGIRNFHYTIVGWGELEDNIREWVKINNLSDYITIVVNPDDLSVCYSNSDIYLSTSVFEGLSNTIMESMGYSLPCVVSDVGDNKKLIVNNYNGYVLMKEDVEGFANALEKLISDSILRQEFGENGYEKIKEYSVENFTKKYLDLIEALNE